MIILRPDRSALLGGAVGAAVTAAGALVSGSGGEYLPLAVLLLLTVAVVGLVLGAAAAAWSYAASALVLLLIAIAGGDAIRPGAAELLRLAIFMLGSPVIVFLVMRLEDTRREVHEALDSSHASANDLTGEQERGEAARRELDVALAAAERERKRLEEVAEAIPEPLIVYDDQLHGTYGNRAALRLFGRSFVERAVDDWGRVAMPRDEQGQPLERELWPQVRGQAAPFKSRLTLRVPMSGRDLTVDVEGTPVPGGGTVLLLRDVGKEEDERRRLSRFASFVAHELRNPLAVAKARMELAHRDPKLGTRAEGHVSRALESVDAAIGILERLELYSRADSGRVEVRREEFPLAPALGAAVERLRARGGEREVRVTMPAGLVVLGDRHLSEQAITNLLTNADRYSTPGTPIHVEVDGDEMVTLRVRDEGPGIADDVAERLFHDRVAAGRGLGLGLYLVHATMSAMGGTVELEQRAPGAVFALRWLTPGAAAAEANGAGAVTPAEPLDAKAAKAKAAKAKAAKAKAAKAKATKPKG
ncbi:MAG: sensor histidine kinase [Candidatus Limnocylindria bacterium]